MAQISFDQIENTTEATGNPPVEVRTLEVSRARTLATAPTNNAYADKGLIGEWDESDIRPPRLNLVNKTGTLADQFTPGTWALDKQHQVSRIDPKDKKRGIPLRVVALGLLKQYQENIPYDDREATPARMFNTAAQVREAGGQVHWSKGAGFFSELATVEFLIQADESLTEDAAILFFNVTEDGTRYARAVATFGSTAFSGVAMPLANSLRTHLAVCGLKGGQWDLGAVLTTKADKSWWSPTIRSAGFVTKAQEALIASI
jgi:hypothetical protein